MSTIRTNTLSNVAGTQSTAIENAIQGSAKAWVNFNGQGTVAIRAAYNVSSITDLATGQYRINFGTSFADTSYVALFGSGDFQGSWTGGHALGRIGNGTKTTSFTQIHLSTNTFSDYDFEEISIAILR